MTEAENISLLINGAIGAIGIAFARTLVSEIVKHIRGKRLVSAVRGKFHVVAKAEGNLEEKSARVVALALDELRGEGYDITDAEAARARAIVESLHLDPSFPPLAEDPKKEVDSPAIAVVRATKKRK